MTAFGGQKQLALAMGVSQSSVSRWANGGPIDAWSCLLLARATRRTTREVIAAAGDPPKLLKAMRDVGLLEEGSREPQQAGQPSPIQRAFLARVQQLVRSADALDGLPEVYWRTYLSKVLDRQESELNDTITLLRALVKPSQSDDDEPSSGHAIRPTARSLSKAARVLTRNHAPVLAGRHTLVPTG